MSHVIPFEIFALRESHEVPANEHVALYEAYSQMVTKLEDAMNNKFVCRIDYRAESGNVLNGVRMIEPVALGVDSSGTTLLRAWLIRGISKTGRIDPRLVPGWRLFRVDRIRTMTPTLEKFLKARKGYNADDKIMSEVMVSVKF